MKLIKKVPTLEVKRSFVVADLVSHGKRKQSRLGVVSKSMFDKKLERVINQVKKFQETKIDKMIGDGYQKRLIAYTTSDWFLAEVEIKEVGVWKKAGGLPLSWTNGSLQETGRKVKEALEKNPKLLTKRARSSIPSMLKLKVADLQKNKYLLPIIFKGGTGTNGRKGLKRRMKGDIDDGSMRSVALAVSGVKTLRAYLGFPNKKAKHK